MTEKNDDILEDIIGTEPGDDAEEVEIDFPEAGDECDVDDAKTSRTEDDK